MFVSSELTSLNIASFIVHACLQELLGAAMGVSSKSDMIVRKKSKVLTKVTESSTFAVTQALVSLLTQKGWTSKMVRSLSGARLLRGMLMQTFKVVVFCI